MSSIVSIIKLLFRYTSSARIYQFSAIQSVALDRDLHQLADLPGLGRTLAWLRDRKELRVLSFGPRENAYSKPLYRFYYLT